MLDLAHGYLQIPLSDEARDKTAIITPEETVEFTRMIFGLMNGPAYFSKAMEKALGPLRDTVALFYLDDVLIPGKSWEDLGPKLRAVLTAFRDAGLTIKLAKCRFLFEKVSYFGHEISAAGIEPGKDKVKAIRDFPASTNVHEIRRFLGLTSYFRKFVPRFAQLAEPLSRLLKSSATFEWKDEQLQAFNALKGKLTEQPVLQTFDPTAPTELHTDASALGLAAMLLQRDKMGSLRLVYAISRRTSEPESRYHSSKLELLAIVWAVCRMRTLIANIPFTVVIGCQALCYLNTQRSLNPQVIRWHDLLGEYDYTIVHRQGVKMADVDALSRAPTDVSSAEEEIGIFQLTNEEDLIRLYQQSDHVIREKVKILEKPLSERSGNEKSCMHDYELRDGLLFKIWDEKALFVVPRAMRKGLVIRFHDLKSHPGADRTTTRVLEHYYFPGVRGYVKQHVHSCLQCNLAKSKPGKQAGELHPIPPGSRPFALIHVDHLGPFVTSSKGNKFIFVIVDNLTKFVVLKAIKDTRTTSVVRVLNTFVLERGAPDRIVSDRGTCFTAKAFESFCAEHGIKHTLNSLRHPQANGQVERVNATIVAAISANISDEEGRTWDRQLDTIQSDLNEMRNATTVRSPFELVFGYVPRRNEGAVRQLVEGTTPSYRAPIDLQDEARARIATAQEKMKLRYDANRNRNVSIDVGSIVFMKTAPTQTGESTKLHPKYRGPLVVLSCLPGDTYRVADLNASPRGHRYATTAHASQLKIWKPHLDDDLKEEHDSAEDNTSTSASDGEEESATTNCDQPNSASSESRAVRSESAGKETNTNESSTPDVRQSTRVKRRPEKLNDYVD